MKSILTDRIYLPANGHLSSNRVADVANKLDIIGKATSAGRKNEPHTNDLDLDVNQRALVGESQGFVASVTRIAESEIKERTNLALSLTPSPLDTRVERANIRRHVAETKDLARDDLEGTFKHQQRALRDQRTFEDNNGLAPFSAIYKDDRAMFIALLVVLMFGESIFNAFSFEELQDRGLLGGLMLALSVGVANVLMGLGAGFIGFRLMIHRQPMLRLLGIVVTVVLLIAGLTLHLALGDLREAIGHDGKAQIDFLVILKPWRWFNYTSIPPFVLFAVGIATFFVAAMKGRGGSWGIVAPYWNHEVMDRRFRAADRAFEDAKANFKDGLQNAYDGEVSKLKTRLVSETANIAEIRRLVSEAQGIERTMNDSIDDEIGRLHTWQRMYRESNQAVRTTPAPAYFATYHQFDDMRKKRLDMSELLKVLAHAEEMLAKNRNSFAELQEEVLDEQTATIDALLTMVSSSERRVTQQIHKEEAIAENRNAQRAD